MPSQDLYTGIAVTIMFLIGVGLGLAKTSRTRRKLVHHYLNKVRAFRANRRLRKAA